MQEKDGGFGSLFATSLAIQAKLSTKVKTEFDIEAAWKNLKSAQKPDGSFGSSVTFTGKGHSEMMSSTGHSAMTSSVYLRLLLGS